MALKIKRNDTEGLAATLKDGRAPVNLNGCAITFAMRQRDGLKKISGSAIPDPDQSANKGKLTFDWPGGIGPDTAGVYDGEFQVTFPSGKVLTYPRDGYEEIVVLADVAP